MTKTSKDGTLDWDTFRKVKKMDIDMVAEMVQRLYQKGLQDGQQKTLQALGLEGVDWDQITVIDWDGFKESVLETGLKERTAKRIFNALTDKEDT